MRIISGSLKGKKIFEPKDKVTRPLKDLTKESIFNVIIHSNKIKINLINSKILDLFSGVGSFGLECLSRGTSFVIFVENYLNVLNILKKNIELLKFQKKTRIVKKDILNEQNFEYFKNKFDLIFLDPPYREKKIKELIIKIKNNNLLNKNGIIIIHRHKKEKDQLPNNFKILLEKKYGISKIIFGKFV